MATFIVKSYRYNAKIGALVWDDPRDIEAKDANEAICHHLLYCGGGSVSHVLGGREFQAHWQRTPATGLVGVEAIHKALDDEKVSALKTIRLHDNRRAVAFEMVEG